MKEQERQDPGEAVLRCCVTGATLETKPNLDGTPRLARGWRAHAGQHYSPEGWARCFILRAVTFPVVGPVTPLTWPQLREHLKSAWTEVTALANWSISELAKADVIRLPDDTARMPKAPDCYLYPEARRLFPQMDPSTIVAVLHDLRGKYMRRRLEVIWRREASLPTIRYPMPLPIPAKAWSTETIDQRPAVSLRLGGERIQLFLRGGPEFRRQLAAFGAIADGRAKQTTLTLYRVRAQLGDQRTAIAERDRKAKPLYRLMCKLTAWLPRTESKAGEGTMPIILGGGAMITALPEGRDPWILHGDHIKTWIIGYEAKRQRLADDLKFEKRMPKRNRVGMQQHLEGMSRRHHDRMDTWLHTSAKMLAEFAARQRLAAVEVVRREPWISFPWSIFLERLEQKLDERGLKFINSAASAEVPVEKPEVLGDA